LSGAGYDIVVTKLNATGTALIGSKKVGGSGDDGVNIAVARNGASSLQQNYGDDGRSEVILDGAGNVYVASCSRSGNFPTTTGSYQPSFGGGSQDGVLLKFDATVTNLLFATYLGGDKNDAAYVLALGPNGNIYVGGGTESDAASFLPGTKAGTIGTTIGGTIDGFVAEMTNNGASVIRSTYIGTGGIDQVFGVQFDRNGFLYIMGQTTGSWQRINIPDTNTVPEGSQFISKLHTYLSGLVYSFLFVTMY